MPTPIRVLIADDHVIVRKGIRALLAAKRDLQVIGEAGNGNEAVALARELVPDVVLMDLMMPDKDGIQATREICSDLPNTKVLVLTSFAADEQVFPALKAGASGYLLKDSSPQELVQAIHQIHRGESSLDPAIARKVLAEFSNPSHPPSSATVLTSRETDILRLIAQGLANKEIAVKLFITEETVHTHVGKILTKLHVSSRTQAALYALKEGIASIEDVPTDGTF